MDYMNTSKPDWIDVQYNSVNNPESDKKNGVTVSFMLSPSDVPTAWRKTTLKDESGERLQSIGFEFKYLSSSERKYIESINGVEFEIGKNSKRVYKIIFNAKELFRDKKEAQIKIEIGLKAEELVHQLADKNKLRDGNASAILSIFKPKKWTPDAILT